jgi:phosphoglycolate phosphatase
MIRAVAFDLDGTLIDSTAAIVDSFYYLFDVIGEPPPQRQDILRGIGAPFIDAVQMLTRHDPHECARLYGEHYRGTACAKTRLLPGARECVTALRAAGLRVGFASSRKLASAEMLLGHLALLDEFDCRITTEQVARGKPHPDLVLKALEALNAEPHEMFYVGDMDFDVLAARAAGVRCLCVATGYATRQELEALGPEAVFDTLEQTTAYILETRRLSA